MTETAAPPATLDGAIEDAVESGHHDPITVVDALKTRHGLPWLKKAVGAKAEDFARDRAREILNLTRRKVERKARIEAEESPNGRAKTATLQPAQVWIPDADGGSFTAYLDVTAADLRAKAAWYRRRAEAFTAYAAWLYDVADEMDAAGATVLAELEEIPPPPSGASVDDLLDT